MNGKHWFAAFLVFALAVPCSVIAQEHEMSPEAKLLPGKPGPESFGPQPQHDGRPYDAKAELDVYGGKHLNRTTFPPIDLGLQLYERGAYDPRPTFLGTKNPVMSAFMAYGDLRVAGANYDNGSSSGDQSVVAARLNLDMDYQLTATERFHAFVRPLDKGGSFTRFQFGSGSDKFFHELNFDLKTLFFEGDLGPMSAGLTGKDNKFDLPIAAGRFPFATQNGIWIDDAFDGLALGLISAKNSARHDISNMDLTFFTGVRDVNTAAVSANDKPKIFGLAGFADAMQGYVEWGYGYVAARNHDLSYHNVTAAFSRRYKGLLSNSVRMIGNFGQSGPSKKADGVLLLIENSLIRRQFLAPIVLVPYVNFFAGFKSPQSLARGGDAGGVLRNTGINFESDGLTAYPTLDARAQDSYGAAVGLERLFNQLDGQIVVEAAVVERRGSSALGNQYALGARYQHRISNAWILRLDAMKGWLQGSKDVYGARVEIRRKF
jgi:hypothetical protein